MPDERCVLIVPGPSSKNVVAEEFAGRTVIAVNAAAVLRDFRCCWWVTDSPLKPEDVARFPPRLRVLTRQDDLDRHNAPGLDKVKAREAAGAPAKGYCCTAVDALILASFLGFKAVEVYGADWSNFRSLRPTQKDFEWCNRSSRMTQERVSWCREAERSGVQVYRVGPEPGAVPTIPPVTSRWILQWAGPPLPGTFPVSPDAGRRTNAERRADIARLTEEISRVDRYEAWLRELAVLGVEVPELDAARGVRGAGSILISDGAWARVGPGITAAIVEGRLVGLVEEERMFAPDGVA